MSRSRQAALLARHLSEVTGVTVELYYDTGARWILGWTDGPRREEMRAHLDAALAGYRYAEMRDRTVDCHRSTSERAWAARAIASRREGALGPAITHGAAYRRSLGVQLPRMGVQDPGESHEYYALLHHVGELCRTTAYPDRASAPEDEPLIEQLLKAGTRDRANTGRPTVSEYDMARALLAAEQAPAGDRPPTLTVVRAPEEGR
ncbi:hypothetical protein QWJ26_24360 [Streptomyces sp. CSDS2]|uniref:hypothetical protein n=1 Tax=Streptomyces sp. CSDS2 TaxID=3055051 RepID=UPI0025AF598C|nr:hypothetical protein [Streptomyces sp. CSDS2]MDN3262882.1 hypothetical protein [Streptomyces sp. CSDS2]